VRACGGEGSLGRQGPHAGSRHEGGWAGQYAHGRRCSGVWWPELMVEVDWDG
jgi:hypothetical protein